MPIYITNQEADELARELSAETGETITDVVIQALRERRDRLHGPTREERIARMTAIADRTAALLDGKRIDVNELYDEYGAPE